MNQIDQSPMGHPMQSPQMRGPAMAGGVGLQMGHNVQPAGFWIRLVASIIDGIIVSMAFYAIAIPVGFMTPGILSEEPSPEALGAIIGLYVLNLVIYLAYMIYFYTQKGGTLGKLAFNIRVVNQNTGAKLTWGQVVLREILGKFLSMITFYIGFIMAGLRSDKKALHDLVSGSQCLRKK